MHFKLSSRSLNTLATVHPDMQRVVKRAIDLTTVDFLVVQGRRTWDEQARLYGQGRTVNQMASAGLPTVYAQPHLPKVTWTMRSNHLSGHAVDLVAWVDGRPNWDTNKGFYENIAHAMKAAAQIEGVPIIWGGDWVSNKDYPHFEMRNKA